MNVVGITGEGGYVSTNLTAFLKKKGYKVIVFDLLNENWEKEYNFNDIDVIVHTAGIVHKKEKKVPYSYYEELNANLTLRLAKKAKSEGVTHFIFMSTEAVYGTIPKLGKTTIIDKNTDLCPTTKYGTSKLKAEKYLQDLASNGFAVEILRCPIIIGKGCPGNYSKLRNFVLKRRVFPKITNQKSMLYVGTLCSFIEHSIVTKASGIYLPQDNFYYCTKDIVRQIGKLNNKTIFISSMVGACAFLASAFLKQLKKALGSSIIDTNLSKFDFALLYFLKHILLL